MDTHAVLELVREVVAEHVTPRFGALERDDVSTKRRPGDLVTVADREAEVALSAALRAAHPDALVVGEEAVSADPTLLRGLSSAAHAYVVDPVDGTRHFVAGSPDHATMLAELRHGRTVRSWIWQPQHGRAYVAEHGAGAWSDGVRIGSATDPRPLRPTGTCCGVDYPRLALGQAGWAAYVKKKPWDHLPGGLLLTEAGGRVVRRAGVLLALSPSASRRA